MARPRALTPDQTAAIVHAYRNGATPHALAARHGVGRNTICRYLTEAGIPQRRAGRIPVYAQALYAVANLLRGELAGCTPAEAAEALVRRAEAITTCPTRPEGTTP